MELRCTIAPRPASTMGAASSWLSCNRPRTLACHTVSNASKVRSNTAERSIRAALLTRIDTGPSASGTSRASRAVSASLPMSAWNTSAVPPESTMAWRVAAAPSASLR